MEATSGDEPGGKTTPPTSEPPRSEDQMCIVNLEGRVVLGSDSYDGTFLGLSNAKTLEFIEALISGHVLPATSRDYPRIHAARAKQWPSRLIQLPMAVVGLIVDALPSVPAADFWDHIASYLSLNPDVLTLIRLSLSCRFFFEMLKPKVASQVYGPWAPWANNNLIVTANIAMSPRSRLLDPLEPRLLNLNQYSPGSTTYKRLNFIPSQLTPESAELIEEFAEQWIIPNNVLRKATGLNERVLRNLTTHEYVVPSQLAAAPRSSTLPDAHGGTPHGNWTLGYALIASIVFVDDAPYEGGRHKGPWVDNKFDIVTRREVLFGP